MYQIYFCITYKQKLIYISGRRSVGSESVWGTGTGGFRLLIRVVDAHHDLSEIVPALGTRLDPKYWRDRLGDRADDLAILVCEDASSDREL